MAFDPKVITPASANDRFCWVIAGPGGTGKSTMLGSMAEVLDPKRILLLATLAREVGSWKYQQYHIPHILYEDVDWRPQQGKYVATGFPKFLQTLEWLRDVDDQYDGVIVDSGTELAELGWHLALMPHGVGSPSEIEGRSRWLPYETLDNLLDQSVKGIVALTKVAKRPKFVGISWHVQPPKDDAVDIETKSTKKSADHAGEGVEYEGKVLPMVRGRYRRRLVNQVDAMLYTDIQLRPPEKTLSASPANMNVLYRVQVRPDQERHTKLPGPLPGEKYIANDFASLMKLMSHKNPTKKE